MTDATSTALIAALAPTLMALGALIQGILNGRKAATIVGTAATIVEKTGALALETEKVHKAVNSNLDAVKADLVIANERIKELSALVVKLTAATAPDSGAGTGQQGHE